jgi:thiamine pyrophosphokinase
MCNGEIEASPSLIEKIKQSQFLIGVDGGLNYCQQLGLSPHWIITDFDSIDPLVLEKYREIGITRLHRAKDLTDLEVAIEKAKELAPGSKMVIFGGLGGRLDHTLTNIFLLLRHPGELFLMSESQIVFALDASIGKICIADSFYKALALFPLNGPAEEVTLKQGDLRMVYPVVDRLLVSPFGDYCELHVQKGELIVILDQREILLLTPSTLQVDFSLSQPIIQTLNYLQYLSLHFRKIHFISKQESVTNIQSSSGKVFFPCKKGQIVSLIPFWGPAHGVKTQGLKWELGKLLSTLSKEFVGISNLATGEEFTLEVEQGQLLCILNHMTDTNLM